MGGSKKRKKDPHDGESPVDTSSDTEDNMEKYQVFKVSGYSRKYPENSPKSEFIVFLAHKDEKQLFTDKDRLAISHSIRKHCINGILHLKPINKYKIGITFDLSNNANVFIQNKKFMDELGLKASIPAIDTEVTGVLNSVPIDLSNKRIFSLIGSSRNVIQVRRFMRRVRNEGGSVSYQPTQTVAVTFASTELPQYVYLDSWRHEVSVYVPPVKQCLHCLKFGHIAKYCKNAEVCSVCTQNHNFKNCTEDPKNAKCNNCGGNHIAISNTCPQKKLKIEENKIRSKATKFSDLFNENSFPQLTMRNIETQVQNLTKSEPRLR
ncbi:uncharacterized protein LOC114363178 [Ostrinia furnacalis]|uniref:uncharacterized protein LOC114363178 n=1 Tax=Ostrinia furnacalis TaxID=93504 RepID=UPI001039CB16|nr:uncharacterized protein LOC114363178 [Ostrinia furnacalis]